MRGKLLQALKPHVGGISVPFTTLVVQDDSNVFLRATFTILSGAVRDRDSSLHFWGRKERCHYIQRAGYCQPVRTGTKCAGHMETQHWGPPRGGFGTDQEHRLIIRNGTFVHLSEIHAHSTDSGVHSFAEQRNSPSLWSLRDSYRLGGRMHGGALGRIKSLW